jgi:hypothetical protein
LVVIEDGTPGTSPCTGGGTGTLGVWLNGSWNCGIYGSILGTSNVFTQPNAFTKQVTFSDGAILGPTTVVGLTSLTSVQSGMAVYVTDGIPGTVPCSGGGSGALAVFGTLAWSCASSGSVNLLAAANTFSLQNTFQKGTVLGPTTVANLGITIPASSGAIAVVTDGTPGTVPCTGGGTGAIAIYTPGIGAWSCSAAGPGSGLVAYLGLANTFTQQNTFNRGTILGPILFSGLSGITAHQGLMVVVGDGLAGSNPCAGGGTGALAIYVNSVWNCNQAGTTSPGQPVAGTTFGGFGPINNIIILSQVCASVAFVNCPLYTDQSYAIRSVISSYGGSGATLHIVDDLCGVQYLTEQPFTGMAGIAEFSANCTQSTSTQPNIIYVDGPLDTIEIPTNVRLIGQGSNSNNQIPDNTFFSNCNPNVDVCPGGGVAQQSGTLNSTGVSSNVMTINFSGSFNVGAQLNSIQVGRELFIYGCTNTTNNGGWVVQASGINITGFSLVSGNTYQFTNTGSNGLSSGNKVRLNGFTGGNSNLNGQNLTVLVAGLTSTTFELTVTGSGYSSGGGYANETSPAYVFNVGVPTGVTSTPSSCGGQVYLEQPVMAIGTGNNTTTYHASVGYVTIDARDMPASGCFVNGTGEEATGTEGAVQCFNATAYYFRWDESSNSYSSNGPGDTNSMGSGPLEGNNDPFYCTKTTCPCNGGSFGCSSVTVGVAGAVPQGTLMACGAGTTRATIAAFSLGNGSQDACQNPNFVGLLLTGLVGAEGPGRFKGHVTMSLSDKSQSGGVPIAGLAGTIGTAEQASGIGIFGSSFQSDFIHTEYFNIGIAICGDLATQYTWTSFYHQAVSNNTSGVHLDGSLISFTSGGIGIDIGTAGDGDFCMDIRGDGLNVGASSSQITYQNNITGTTCKDDILTFQVGHSFGANPVHEQIDCATGTANVMTIGGNGTGIKIGQNGNTDNAGTLSFSAGTSSTSYTFKGSYTNPPFCVGTPSSDPGSGNRVWISTLSATTLTFSSSNTLTTTIRYVCFPGN